MNKQTQVSVAAAVLLIVFAIAVVIYNEKKSDEQSEHVNRNASLLVRDYSPVMGAPEAKVTLVEFFDPACGTCKAFHPFVKQMLEAYPGKLKLVLRYAPLHRGSDQVVKLLEASRLQNKFWQTLDATYAAQEDWVVNHVAHLDRLWNHLGHLGLDPDKLQTDMGSTQVAQRVQQDIADGRQLQVNRTPGFFVNGKPLVQFGSKQLEQLVEAEIRKHY